MQSFLIIQTAFFGDVILATGLVEQLAQAYPKARIDMLVQKSREVLLKNNPHLNEVYLLDKSNKRSSVYALIKTLRKKRYDKVINVHRHGTSGLLTVLSGAKETIGFDAHPMSRLFHRKISHQREGNHEIERNFELVQHFVKAPICKPRLYPSDEDFRRVQQDRPYITVSPASVWETKRWPMDRWVALINKMPVTLNIFLLGGPGDVDLCQQIVKNANRPVRNEAGNLSFLESAALMANADMNYTNDSAPVHMASAMNAPVTTVVCSTIPAFGYGPLSDDSYIAQYPEKLSCRPCGIHGHKSCPQGHFRCASIDVDDVNHFLRR